MSLFGQLDPAMWEAMITPKDLHKPIDSQSPAAATKSDLNLVSVIFKELWVSQLQSDLHFR